eukprot:365969-Chlamydomonas_euryale.AAC.7
MHPVHSAKGFPKPSTIRTRQKSLESGGQPDTPEERKAQPNQFVNKWHNGQTHMKRAPCPPPPRAYTQKALCGFNGAPSLTQGVNS